MHTDIPEHAGAILMMNLGHLQPSRPSLGSWLVYGLGAENSDLPGFVAMSPRAQPRGKLANWGNSFLPGAYAGTYINIHDMKPDRILRDLENQRIPRASAAPAGRSPDEAQPAHLDEQVENPQLEASIQAMEMAFRMQMAVPEAFAVEKETQRTRELYGDSEYAKGCLIARRLVDARGSHGAALALDRRYDIAWDTGHGDIKGGHARLANACDQGIAALLIDLEERGLLDETLDRLGRRVWPRADLGRALKRTRSPPLPPSPPGWPGGGIKSAAPSRGCDRRVFGLSASPPKPDPRPRPSRHHPPPHGPRPREAHLPLLGPGLPVDRCPRRGDPGHHRLRFRSSGGNRGLTRINADTSFTPKRSRGFLARRSL